MADYLKSLPQMRYISWDRLKRLAIFSRLVKFKRNEIVVRCGEKVKGIFIVKQGHFELSVDIFPEAFKNGRINFDFQNESSKA